MKYPIPCCVILMIFLSCGCGENVRLQGKVTFSDDNSPLTTGTVCFENDNYFARGILQPDGSYEVGSLSSKDGILPGTYRVSISGAMEDVGTDKDGMPVSRLLIDEKYTNAATSGLEFVVDGTTKTFDISVDRAKK